MIGQFFRKSPIVIWAIKQIDDATLHLCGQGRPEPQHPRKQILADLDSGHYHGGIHMQGTGIVINTRLLAAVVPEASLRLRDDGNTAEWQGKRWAVAHVPQRSWLFEGRLVAEHNPLGTSPLLVSHEDVSHIRQSIREETPTPPAPPWPDSLDSLRREAPDGRPQEPHRRRAAPRRGWRADGSWGTLDDPEDR